MNESADQLCDCHVEDRQRDPHVYGGTTDGWCVDHETWHAAEHHWFSGGEFCAKCGNAERWHHDPPAILGEG